MKAIETEYNGYKFRSRLEARWAVFFDDVGIKYEYEPEGFKTHNNEWYLPDFYLPDIKIGWEQEKGTYIEIKRQGMNIHSMDNKYMYFDKPIVVFAGDPFDFVYYNIQLNPESLFSMGFIDDSISYDYPANFFNCTECDTSWIAFPNNDGRQVCDNCGNDTDEENTGKMVEASKIARSHRFDLSK